MSEWSLNPSLVLIRLTRAAGADSSQGKRPVERQEA